MKTAVARKEISDLILDSADILLARYGYGKMTMDDLAREVGIGKGTIYLHFQSKQEVILSHIDRIISRLKERLLIIARSDAPPADRLRLMLVERVLFRFDSVQHYTESLSDVLKAVRSAFLARRSQHYDDEAEIFAAVLKDGKRIGELGYKDVRSTAHALLLATNSLLPYSLSTNELGRRDEVEKKVSQIADLIINGLRQR